MHIDKPMKGHGLMQAIARVNRVFPDKNALRQYSTPDQENMGVDESQAVAVMQEKYEVVRACSGRIRLRAWTTATP